MFQHWVLRTKHGFKPFNEREANVIIWKKLRTLFPEVYAAVLMPNHAHWITDQMSESKTSDVIYRLEKHLRYFEKEIKTKFEAVPRPLTVPDQKHLLRTVRYIHLNPCRSKLVNDPLEWEWSTHHEYLGLNVKPWAQCEKFYKQIRARPHSNWFHQYVSSDPTAAVEGTPYLTQIGNTSVTVEDLMSTCLIVSRSSAHELYKKQGLRKSIVHLAVDLNIYDGEKLAPYLKISSRAVREMKRQSHLPRLVSKSVILQMVGDMRILKMIRLIGATLNLPKSGRFS